MENLPAAVLTIIAALIFAMGLWYLSIRLYRPRLKRVAVALGVLPILVLGVQFGQEQFGWGYSDTFSTATPGPAGLKGSTTREVRFPIKEPSLTHEIELTPRAAADQAPSVPVELQFRVQSPQGEVYAQGEQSLAPADAVTWSPLRVSIQPKQRGDHLLIVEIPGPVDVLDVKVRELPE